MHLLPIIFALTMLVSTKTMQSPGAGNQQGSMKMMMYFMPVFLFFVLYSAPSGLLVYWIMTNFLTMAQQKAISKHRAKAQEAEGETNGSAGAQKRSKVKHPQAVSSPSSKGENKNSTASRGKGGGKPRAKKKK